MHNGATYALPAAVTGGPETLLFLPEYDGEALVALEIVSIRNSALGLSMQYSSTEWGKFRLVRSKILRSRACFSPEYVHVVLNRLRDYDGPRPETGVLFATHVLNLAQSLFNVCHPVDFSSEF